MGDQPATDPSELTTKQLLREITILRELIDAMYKGAEQITAEKFNAVTGQFELIERQRVEQKMDTKAAVDAALTAQKEAVKEQTTASERAIAKSEAATKEQLNQLSATFTAAIKGLTDILNDTKERVSKNESARQGSGDTVTKMIAIIAVCAAVAGFVLNIYQNGK